MPPFFDRPAGRRMDLRGSSSRPPTSQELLAAAKRNRMLRMQQRQRLEAAQLLQSLHRARLLRHALLEEEGSESSSASQHALSSGVTAVVRVLLASSLLRQSSSSSLSAALHVFPHALRNTPVLPTLRLICSTYLHSPSAASSLAAKLHSCYPAIAASMLCSLLTLLLCASSEYPSLLFAALHLLEASLPFDVLSCFATSATVHRFSQLLRARFSRRLPQSCDAPLSRMLSAVFSRLPSVTATDPQQAQLLYSQLALALLPVDSVVPFLRLSHRPDLVHRLVDALAHPPPAPLPSLPHFQFDRLSSISQLSVSDIALLLSNLIHLADLSQDNHSPQVRWNFVSVISLIIHALPTHLLHLSDRSPDDDDDDDRHHQRNSPDRPTVQSSSPTPEQHHPIDQPLDAATLRAIISRVGSSLDRIVSADLVRNLFTTAIAEGRHAVLVLCDLFKFLSDADSNVVNPMRDALSLWPYSGSVSQPHVLASLWCHCIIPTPGVHARDVTLRKDCAPILSVFCTTYAYLLFIHDAQDIFESSWPFAVDDMRQIASVLKHYLFGALYGRSAHSVSFVSDPDPSDPIRSSSTNGPLSTDHGLLDDVTQLVSRLYAVDTQRRFTLEDHFWEAGNGSLSSHKFLNDAIKAGPEALVLEREETTLGGVRQRRYGSGRQPTSNAAGELLRVAPFLVPFSLRLKIFQYWIAKERDLVHNGPAILSEITVQIRRDRLFDDAFERLNGIGKKLRQTLRIKFVDMHGIEEAGIDGGGMLKEFMQEVSKLAFSPFSYGLFKSTPDGHLYPNPDARLAIESFKTQYEFAGRLLGKAVFDGVLVDVPLAKFFRLKMLGEMNYPTDLASMDPELYKNVKFLKSCPAETVEDLGLNFTVVNHAFGVAQEFELKRNGRNVPVTGSNRIEYIHRLAHYRMNQQIKEHSDAFIKGFYELVPHHYVRLFSHEELQLLISGKGGKIDVDDWQRNTRYSGGYTEETPVIRWFWTAVSELEDEDQAKMLQFVTSCPRAPLLGFAYLVPGFCIHRAEGDIRLPTASTCMNLLKLPEYKSLSVVREKLKYALQANAGFDLS